MATRVEGKEVKTSGDAGATIDVLTEDPHEA